MKGPSYRTAFPQLCAWQISSNLTEQNNRRQNAKIRKPTKKNNDEFKIPDNIMTVSGFPIFSDFPNLMF